MAMLYLRNKPIGAISSGASGGGHTIENTSGTDMEQRSDLQFVGVYTEDDSANDRTKVNVVRTMTKAQMDALSAAEKVGFIRTSDEADNPYNGIEVKAYTTTASDHSGDVFSGVTVNIDSKKVARYGQVVCISVAFRISATVSVPAWSTINLLDISDWDLGDISWFNGSHLIAVDGTHIGMLSVASGKVCLVTVDAVSVPTKRISGMLVSIVV